MASFTRLVSSQARSLRLTVSTTEQRCLHTSRVANVAMSKFDQNSVMPYEKLVAKLEVNFMFSILKTRRKRE